MDTNAGNSYEYPRDQDCYRSRRATKKEKRAARQHHWKTSKLNWQNPKYTGRQNEYSERMPNYSNYSPRNYYNQPTNEPSYTSGSYDFANSSESTQNELNGNSTSDVNMESDSLPVPDIPNKNQRISLVPLSSLLREDFIVEHMKIFQETQPEIKTASADPEEVCKKIVDQAVLMSKRDIRSIIDNPSSRYEEAFRTLARKKERQNIREQLKAIQVDVLPSEAAVLEADETVDQMPVLDEISRALGIDLDFFHKENTSVQEINSLSNEATVLQKLSGRVKNNMNSSTEENSSVIESTKNLADSKKRKGKIVFEKTDTISKSPKGHKKRKKIDDSETPQNSAIINISESEDELESSETVLTSPGAGLSSLKEQMQSVRLILEKNSQAHMARKQIGSATGFWQHNIGKGNMLHSSAEIDISGQQKTNEKNSDLMLHSYENKNITSTTKTTTENQVSTTRKSDGKEISSERSEGCRPLKETPNKCEAATKERTPKSNETISSCANNHVETSSSFISNISDSSQNIEIALEILNKRKTYIDEVLTTLQNHRTAVDLSIRHLKNEKFRIEREKSAPSIDLHDISCQLVPGFESIPVLPTELSSEARRKTVSSDLHNESNLSSSPQKDSYKTSQQHSDILYKLISSEMSLPLITCLNVHRNCIIFGSESGTVHKIDWKSCSRYPPLKLYRKRVLGMRIEDDDTMHTISSDGFLKKHSLERWGVELGSFEIPAKLICFDIATNFICVVTSDGRILTVDYEKNRYGKQKQCLKVSGGPSIQQINIGNCGKIIITLVKRATITVYNLLSGLLLYSITPSMKQSPLCTIVKNHILYVGSSGDAGITLYDISAGNETVLERLTCEMTSKLKLVKNRLLLAVSTNNLNIYVYDIRKRTYIGKLPVKQVKGIQEIDVLEDKILIVSINRILVIDMPNFMRQILMSPDTLNS